MNIASDIRVASHQERLHHDLVRQVTEMRLLVNMRRDTRRRQSLARLTMDRIEDLRRIELLTSIVNSVEDLSKNRFISILHDRRWNRDISEAPGNLLDMRGVFSSVRIVSQPRQRAPQIE